MIARYVPSQQGPAGRKEMSPYDLVLFHCAKALAAAEAAGFARGMEHAADVCSAISSRYRAQHDASAENISDECDSAIRAAAKETGNGA